MTMFTNSLVHLLVLIVVSVRYREHVLCSNESRDFFLSSSFSEEKSERELKSRSEEIEFSRQLNDRSKELEKIMKELFERYEELKCKIFQEQTEKEIEKEKLDEEKSRLEDAEDVINEKKMFEKVSNEKKKNSFMKSIEFFN